MSVLVEFAMFPTDKGESVSPYVSRIIKMLSQSDILYQLTPMGTIYEVETMPEALEILNNAYSLLQLDCNRVYSSVKFDIQKNKSGRMLSKMKSVEEKLDNC